MKKLLSAVLSLGVVHSACAPAFAAQAISAAAIGNPAPLVLPQLGAMPLSLQSSLFRSPTGLPELRTALPSAAVPKVSVEASPLRTTAALEPRSSERAVLPLAERAAVPVALRQAPAPTGKPVIAESLRRALPAQQSEKGSPEAAQSLNKLFDHSLKGVDVQGINVPVTAVEEQGRSSLLAPASHPQTRDQEPPKPRSTLSRSAKFGLVFAAIGLLVDLIVPMAAAAAGYEFHSNYRGPNAIRISGFVDALRMFTASVIMAPVTEEVAFRGVLMGGLVMLGKKVADALQAKPKLAEALVHWAPAVLSSVIFVALHETADPVAFAIRMVTSLLLSEAFHKEGLFASITMHMVNNFIPMIGLASQMFLGPGGHLLSMFAFVATLALANKFWDDLKAQEADRKAGRIVPKPLTPGWAVGLAALSVFGVLFAAFSLKGAVLWGTAAFCLLVYAAAYWRKGGPPMRYPEIV